MRAAHIGALVVAALSAPAAQSRDTLADRVDAIMARPEFKHASFGIEFYALDTNSVVYEHNADRFFVPGSTTKLVTGLAGLSEHVIDPVQTVNIGTASYRLDLTDPKQLASLLTEFYAFTEPEIEGFRQAVVLGKIPSPGLVGISLVGSLVIALAGYPVLKRLEPNLADRV